VCLECGSRVALDYRRPPSWRVPVAILTAVILLTVAGAAIAIKKIGDDAEREVDRTPVRSGNQGGPAGAQGKEASTKPTAEKKPAEEKPATRKETPPAPAPASGTELVKQGDLYRWPPELKAFTVVLLSGEDRASAENFARSASKGRPAKIGVIRADDFKSLPKGFFVVFAGQYEERATADRAADRLGKRFSGSFPQLVER